MAEDLKEYITKATQANEDLKDSFEEVFAIHSEAQEILEAKKKQGEESKLPDRRCALGPHRKGEFLNDKLWNWSQ